MRRLFRPRAAGRRWHTSSSAAARPPATPSVDAREIDKFNNSAREWWGDEGGGDHGAFKEAS